MNENSEVIIIPQNNNTKIFRPKPKKLCISHNILHSKKSHKKNFPFLNSNMNLNKKKSELGSNKRPKLDFDKISFEEIESDFNKLKKLKKRNELIEVENELLSLLRNSTKENSSEDDNKDTIKIRRPKKIFLENIS